MASFQDYERTLNAAMQHLSRAVEALESAAHYADRLGTFRPRLQRLADRAVSLAIATKEAKQTAGNAWHERGILI